MFGSVLQRWKLSSKEACMRRISLRRPWLAVISVIVTALTATVTAVAVAVPAGAASDFSLLVLPDQGESAIYSFASSATSSIDLTMYELKDTTLVNDLVAREKAGVDVRVILDREHESYDSSAYSTLTKGGVSVVWSSSAFTYTHQKTLTVDNRESYITTGNFDTTYYSTSRDYGIFDTDPADVAAVVATFNADFAHKSITPSDGDDLVWSPTDSQTRLLSLINGAKSSLDIEQEEFSDSALVSAIVSAEKRGVKVRVVVEDPSSYSSELKQVISAGGTVAGYSSSTGFYIHAKAIVADDGTPTAKVFAGSENFSSNSLNDNRELGLITTDSAVLSGIESAFTSDYDGGARYTG
jgi:phosphatidylserine/phosphatidylglycerophosphate/cardiolipin synthase-like enzyme